MPAMRIGPLRLPAYALIAALLAAPAAPDVHQAATVIDLHCDTILELHAGGRTLDQRSVRGHVDLPAYGRVEWTSRCLRSSWRHAWPRADRPALRS